MLGELPGAQEVDRDNQQRVADSRGDASHVEQRVDGSVDHARRLIDRAGVGQIDLDELTELGGRAAHIEADHHGTQIDQLFTQLRADSRRAAGDHHAAAVVPQQIVDASHGLLGFPLLLLQLRGLHPALIDFGHRSGISPAVNFPPRPVGSPPNE